MGCGGSKEAQGGGAATADVPPAQTSEKKKKAAGRVDSMHADEGPIQTKGASSITTQALVKDHGVGSGLLVTDVYDGVPLPGQEERGDKLGTGGTASVYRVTHKQSKKVYALKVVKLSRVSSDSKKSMLLREIALIKMLDHPNVIRVIEVFQSHTKLYIVMEVCTGGELFDKLYAQPKDRFSEADAKYLAKKMLGALSYLHANKIVHRDLKLENFIFTSKETDADIKLIDFGFSRQYLETETTKMTNLVGTCYYLAPEVINKAYTEAADVWSFGVVLFMMLTGAVPFGGSNGHDIVKTIQEKTRTPSVYAEHTEELKEIMTECKLSRDCQNFLMRLLTVDQEARITCPAALDHDWMTSATTPGRRQTLGTESDEKKKSARNVTLVKNLKDFKNNSQLKRSAMMAVSFGLDSKALTALSDSFTSMDENNDGLISLAEFSKMMKEQGSNPEEIQVAFTAIDQDGAGVIKYSEFISAAISEQEWSADEAIEAAFHALDLDDDGDIDLVDLRKLLPADIDEAAMERMLATADVVKDGKLDLAEFKQMMQGASL